MYLFILVNIFFKINRGLFGVTAELSLKNITWVLGSILMEPSLLVNSCTSTFVNAADLSMSALK